MVAALMLDGRRFGRLVAMRVAPGPGPRKWECVCDCGSTRLVQTYKLTAGSATSCGCLTTEMKRDSATTHGGSALPEYVIWAAMKRRCANARSADFPMYGGRGVKVCALWLNDFSAFYDDMGPRPSAAHSIDRIDAAGHYSPENCRWATATEQARNRRTTVFIEHDGRRMTAAEWSKELGVDYKTIMARKYLGWADAKIVTYGRTA